MVIRYTVVYEGEGRVRKLNVTAPANSITLFGIGEGANYSVMISATNSAGESAYSNSISTLDCKQLSPNTNICLFMLCLCNLAMK